MSNFVGTVTISLEEYDHLRTIHLKHQNLVSGKMDALMRQIAGIGTSKELEEVKEKAVKYLSSYVSSSVKEEISSSKKLEKLKRLVLLTDDSVSGVEMNELTTKQWIEFVKCFPEEGLT